MIILGIVIIALSMIVGIIAQMAFVGGMAADRTGPAVGGIAFFVLCMIVNVVGWTILAIGIVQQVT